MKKLLIVLLALAMVLLPTAGCDWLGQSAVELGKEFSLYLGDGAAVRGEGLSIVFADVTEDSRCPTGVVCIWAGQVSCSVLLTKSGGTYTETFTQSGLTSEPATESAMGYLFSFRVEPYPETGQEIAAGDYRLVMTVSKQ